MAALGGVTWTDLTNQMANANVCIKAFTGTRDAPLSCGSQLLKGAIWQTRPEPATRVCRPSRGPCDLAEKCDGITTRCPADSLRPSSDICRPSTGPCDLARLCTGSSASCPAQAFTPEGTVCRASTGECDLTERCAGDSARCPDDSLAHDGAPCASGEGTCGAGQCQEETGCSTSGPASGGEACGLLWLLAAALLFRERRARAKPGRWPSGRRTRRGRRT